MFNKEEYIKEVTNYSERAERAQGDEELLETILNEMGKYQCKQMTMFYEEYREKADSKAKRDICDMLDFLIRFSTVGIVTHSYMTKAEAQAVLDEALSKSSMIAPMLTDNCEIYQDEDGWVLDLQFYLDFVPYAIGFEYYGCFNG